jgi:hypothetical protein
MEATRSFTNADDARLISLIQSAKSRLVFAAPGVSTAVGKALAEVVHLLLPRKQVVIILDVDPEICRLGYGTIEGLELVQQALVSHQLRLQSADGLRVGLLISDDQTLIYSPTPLLVEAGSTAPTKPNAIILQPNAAEAIAAACGVGTGADAAAHQEMGLEFVDQKKLNEVKADLKENPPKQFNLARLERVFNYELQFVEFKVEGYRLGRKILPLDAEWLGLSDRELKNRFHNTFRLFDDDSPLTVTIPALDENGNAVKDKTEKLSEKTLTDQSNALRKELIPLGAYGSVILKRKRADFEKHVAVFRKRVDAYRDKINTLVDKEIAEVKKKLVDDLTPGLVQKPPKSWLDHTFDGKLDEERIKQLLGEGIDRALVQIRKDFSPAVTLVFKDVTYTTIVHDPEFRKKLEAHFGVEDVKRLFREWDSARGDDPGAAAVKG